MKSSSFPGSMHTEQRQRAGFKVICQTQQSRCHLDAGDEILTGEDTEFDEEGSPSRMNKFRRNSRLPLDFLDTNLHENGTYGCVVKGVRKPV